MKRALPWVVAIFTCAGLLSSGAMGQSRAPWERIEVVREMLNGDSPRTGPVHLELPAVTQDGSAVNLSVRVDHPMETDHYVESLYLFATGNPNPEIAEFRFSPMAGKASISTRVRLDGSQSVVALARTNRGEWLAGSRDIRVTVSGCLSQGSSFDAADFMRARVRAPNRVVRGQPVEVRTLINHPMETGLRKGSDGAVIPERILERFSAELNGEAVVSARFHRALSANPYLLFHVAPGQFGEMSLEWQEDTGAVATERVVIPRA